MLDSVVVWAGVSSRNKKVFPTLTQAYLYADKLHTSFSPIKLVLDGVVVTHHKLSRWLIKGFPETKDGKRLYWKLKTEGYFNERN